MKYLTSFASLLLSLSTCICSGADDDYKLLYSSTFKEQSDQVQWKLPEGCSMVEKDGRTCVQVTRTVRGQLLASHPFAFSQNRGKVMVVTCQAKAENVTTPTNAWNGVKLMISYGSPSIGRVYRNIVKTWGTFDWQLCSFSFTVDEDAEDGQIFIGLEDVTGTAWFDEVKVFETNLNRIFPSIVPQGFRCEYSEAIRNAPTYRGCMSPDHFSETTLDTDLPDLRSWGANIIRWQLIRHWHTPNSNQDCEEYLDWVRKRIPEIRKVLDKCSQLGIKVVLDLHVAPGGRNDNGNLNMFRQKHFADCFKHSWRELATAIKGHPALYGYDLINEPQQEIAPVPFNYLQLQYDVAQIVRDIDSVTPIIIEANCAASPSAFTYLSPLPLKDIIYQVHMYVPGGYTHQGVGNARKNYRPITYPNPARNWDKRFLRHALKPVRDFELKYGAKIYVGEFSAARWAPGAETYLNDVIDIFEEYGWDWTYHAFRESDTWSVEKYGIGYTDVHVAEQNTARKKALLRGFKLNKY